MSNQNKPEYFPYSNISSTPATFQLKGGNYGVTVTATFGGGSVTFNKLSQDGTTWVPVVPAFTANGYANVSLPPGNYQLAIATATAVYAEVTSTVSSY